MAEHFSYDGFISYSHAADGLLAPRLQAGLQRFAKPWWKRRALRMFRDESSLSANPHLWSSITEALDESGWFVLLLSPEAAGSEWVGQEIEYWTTHRDPSRILPVVTDGEFGWSDGDVAGDAVPAALRGVFTEEPRWVDLRWAKDEDQLDLQDPRFADAVADIGSALRGVPKDELASEEVREHRRTVRMAWLGGLTLAALAVLSGALAIQSSNNAAEARRQAEVAAANAAEAGANAEAEAEARNLADANAAEADANATEAETQRRAAEQAAAVARSRELSASAIAALDEDPELSVLLAVESIKVTPDHLDPSPEAVRTLRQALAVNRLEGRLDGVGPYAHLSPDGSILYHLVGPGAVAAVDLATRETLWISNSFPRSDPGRIDVSPDGRTVTTQIHSADGHEVLVLDASDGSRVATLGPSNGCSGLDTPERLGFSAPGGFSPGGQWFTVLTGGEGCGEVPGAGWVAVYDTADWTEVSQLTTDDGTVYAASFSADGSRVLLSSIAGRNLEFRSFPDLELLASHPNAWTYAALSPDGARMAYLRGDRGPVLSDALTGEVLKTLSQADDTFFYVEPFVFSPDGSRLLAAGAARDLVFDPRDGVFLGSLATGPTVSSSFTADGSTLLTATGGDALIWGFGLGSPIAANGLSGDWVNPDQATEGPTVAVNVIDFEGPPALAVLDVQTTEAVGWQPGWWSQLADGRFVGVPIEATLDTETIGPLQVWDPAANSIEVLGGCALTLRFPEPPEGFDLTCPDGQPFFGGGAVRELFSAAADPGGEFFAVRSFGRSSEIHVHRQSDLSQVARFDLDDGLVLSGMTDHWIVASGGANVGQSGLVAFDYSGGVVATIPGSGDAGPTGSVLFNNDGSLMFARDEQGSILVYSTDTWDLLASWVAHSARIRGWGMSAAEDSLATAGEDGVVHVWDITSLSTTANPPSTDLTIPVGHRVSDVVWLGDDRLAIFAIDLGSGARWFVAPLEVDELVQGARTSVTKGFSVLECEVYRIDPCPTLEVRGG